MLKEKLLSIAVIRKDTVEIDGLAVTVREIGTVEFARYGELARGKRDDNDVVIVQPDKLKATALLISVCVIDDSGATIFTEEEALPLASNARVAMPIVNKVMNLSGFGQEADEKHANAG